LEGHGSRRDARYDRTAFCYCLIYTPTPVLASNTAASNEAKLIKENTTPKSPVSECKAKNIAK